MNISLYIATRYLRARRSLQFISGISMLSFAGIIVGVAAIVCVSSIFNGFREVYTTSMLAYEPHIRIESGRGRLLSNTESIFSLLSQAPAVKAFSGVVTSRVVLQHSNRFHVLSIHGVDPAEYSRVSGIERSVIVGRFLNVDTSTIGKSNSAGALGLQRNEPIVIGAELAMNADLDVGDTAIVLSPDFIADALQSFVAPQGVPVVVAGVFYTNSKELNMGIGFAQQTLMRRLIHAPDQSYTSIDVRIRNDDDVQEVASFLQRTMPSNTRVQTWYDVHKDVYGVMRYERYASFIILSVIVFISVFNIFAMLSMTVVKKRRDIGVLIAMGASQTQIRSVFLWEGVVVGSIGTIAGITVGVVLCVIQQRFEVFRFDPQTFIMSAIPVSIAWPEVLAVGLLTLVSSFIATILPAHRAATAHVADALRTE